MAVFWVSSAVFYLLRCPLSRRQLSLKQAPVDLSLHCLGRTRLRGRLHDSHVREATVPASGVMSEGRAAENPVGSVADLSKALDGIGIPIPQLRSLQSGSTLGYKGTSIWLGLVCKDRVSLGSTHYGTKVALNSQTSKPAQLPQALF